MDGFGDVEFVHGRQDNGGCGQEKQHQEEAKVDSQPLEPPAEALDGEVLPAEGDTGQEALLPGTGHLPCHLCHGQKSDSGRPGH